MTKILFVCTGNTCRSPMAEALLRRLASDLNASIEVKSAGVAALTGQPMAAYAAEALAKYGVNGEEFRSSEVTGELVEWADVILTMTTGHKRHLLERFPAAADKTFVLKEYAEEHAEASELFQQRESLAAEMQLKLALNQKITEEERQRLFELEQKLPNFDIADPFGGSLEMYEQTAAELQRLIEAALRRFHR